MNIYSIPQLLTSILLLVLIFLLSKSQKSQERGPLILMCLGGIIWMFSFFLMFNSSVGDEKTAFIFGRVGWLGVTLIPMMYYHFVLKFLKIKENKLLPFVHLLGVFFILLIFFSNSVIRGVHYFYWGFYPLKGNLHPIYLTYVFALFVICLINLYKSYQKTYIPLERLRIKYVFWAFLLGNLGSIDFIQNYGFEFYPFGCINIGIFATLMTYSIIRYRLMDINIAITRTGIFVAVYTLVLGIPFAIAVYSRQHLIDLFGGHWWIVPLGVMAVLATVGPFLYIFVERRAEEALLKEQRKYQQTLKQASLGMTRIRNLHRLLSLIVHIVTKTVRLSYAAIYLHDKQAGEYVLQVKRDKGRTFQHRIPADSHLVNWLQTKREPIIYDEIKRKREDTRNVTFIALEERMREIPAAVIIPSFLEDKFMGFFVLGEKLSGHIYTPEDLNVFQVLATQAALAIENAQFYEETKELQGQIAQAEKMATIGTMADGLSHQINNRFYALSLIAGDSIDTIKMTDTTACSPEIREMLESINHALERIQSNVMQGGEVVKGILKYTRKGDEGIAPVTLDQVIDGTLDMVRYKIKLSEFDIVRDYTKELPAIQGNLVQLQEVFFNLIDNAYDAMMERKTTLQEPGYRGKLVISARENEGGAIEIRVTDNGIGVRDTHSQKIFTPFFTTKTSNRKGTGLGLYVINKIITDTHKGKINFASRYKEGTTFLIELPKAGETPPLQSLQPGV